VQYIGDLISHAAAVGLSTPGDVLYSRFNDEPDTLAIAVIDDQGDAVGLVERQAFFTKMASQYGRSLYAARPISLLMDTTPLIVDVATRVSDFTGKALSTGPSALLKGFIGVDGGRYVGVGSALSLLSAANAANQAQAERMTELAESLAAAESQALAREASFRLLFEANPVAMCLWDRDTLDILSVNEAALTQYGYGAEALRNLKILGDSPQDETSHRPHIVGAEATAHQTWRHRRADGTMIEVLPLVRSLTYDARPARLAALFDITQRERDAEILAQARDAAEAANRAKSEFLANMSHEIRTPLNGVLGVAGVLARTSLDAAQRDMVAIIESSGLALDRLLSDILDIARVESGRLSVVSEPFALGELVRETASLFAPAAREKGLSYQCAIAPDAEVVAVGDAFRIKQVMVNLVSNAVKFTHKGEVSISAAFRQGVVEIEVRDSGVGFDPERKAALFDRFEQADGSITRRFGGSGLGLAISRDLAELMGGSLDADSTPGAGSTFRLSLSLPIEPAASPNRADPQPEATANGARVLLADDHETNRKVVELIMGCAGAELVSVADGAQAVATFKARTFDVVLMDMQMPIMDGLTAIREIRKFERAHGLAPTPILALTANTMPEHIRAACKAGADAHIAKPVTAASLVKAVETALSSAGQTEDVLKIA
jgi:PAS domain S-box-containing protein